ncbi:hypothetical protein ACFLZV_01995 [Candidatus Margulisiibacteriota bacterium]
MHKIVSAKDLETILQEKKEEIAKKAEMLKYETIFSMLLIPDEILPNLNNLRENIYGTMFNLEIWNPQNIKALISLLKNESPDIRSTTSEILSILAGKIACQLGTQKNIAIIMNRIEKESDDKTLENYTDVIMNLVEYKNIAKNLFSKTNNNIFINLLSHENELIRENSVYILATLAMQGTIIFDETNFPKIANLLKTELLNDEVNIDIMRPVLFILNQVIDNQKLIENKDYLLDLMGSKKSLEFIFNHLSNPSRGTEDLNISFFNILDKLASESKYAELIFTDENIPILFQKLNDKNQKIRENCCSILLEFSTKAPKKLGTTQNIELLVKNISNPKTATPQCYDILSELTEVKAFQAVIEKDSNLQFFFNGLSHENPDVRTKCSYIIGNTDIPEDLLTADNIALLTNGSQDSDETVRENCSNKLNILTEQGKIDVNKTIAFTD